MSVLDQSHHDVAKSNDRSVAERIFDETQTIHEPHKKFHTNAASIAAGKKLTECGVLPALALSDVHNQKHDANLFFGIFKNEGPQVKYDEHRDNCDGSKRVKEVDYGDGTSRRFGYTTVANPEDPNKTIEVIYRVKDRDGTTWLRDDDGVFQHLDRENNNLGSRDFKVDVDAEGTVQFTENSDKSCQRLLKDDTTQNFDEDGNMIKSCDARGRTKEYTYDKGTICQVKDADGTDWKRDEKGVFHQYNSEGDETGRTASGGKFMPASTDTTLCGPKEEAPGNGTPSIGKIIADSLFPKEISPDDIRQGHLGDCYFLSAITAVCEREPEKLKEMIKRDPENSGGYIVTFPGAPDEPIHVEAPTEQELARFAHKTNGTWVCVLEKAHRYFADKEHYDRGGWSSQTLSLVTGKNFSTHFFMADTVLENTPSWIRQIDGLPTDFDHLKVVESQLMNGISQNQEMCAGTNGNTLLVPKHEYTVLGYDPVTKTVTMRNPWGYNLNFDKVPSAKRCDKDHDDGKFTLSLEDFYKNYSELTTQKPD
jgi:Calpain family cysteine protease